MTVTNPIRREAIETAEWTEWFRNERGIEKSTLDAFAIAVSPDGGVVFPYANGTKKTRWHRPDGTRSFKTEGAVGLFSGPLDPDARAVFLVEGETDAMRLWQELDGSADVFAISGISGWKDEFAATLAGYERVFVVLDNDADYNVAAKVDKSWAEIRRSLGSKARRIRLPGEVKDVCEFFTRYNIDALRTLAKHRGSGVSRFNPLDLTKQPPPVRWVVDGMFCRGDVHLMIGEPGIGKSWLTMALATGVADEWQHYLGKPIVEHGRVLYLDEENPEDLIFDRFTKLGMDAAAARNIRYINNEGLRLDQNPEPLIEEALEYDPTLIVLDSLSRFHAQDENNAGAMAALFSTSLKPLARETGAAVVLIHHVNKSDGNSSFRRSRGSGDITASPDSGFDVRQLGAGILAVANFKSRRVAQTDTLYVTFRDEEDGTVHLDGGDDVPF